MNFGENITPETPEEIAEYEAMYKRDREKEQKTKMVETGNMELNVKVPNLLPEEATVIARDVRRTLENCARLEMLDEFVETRAVEYKEVTT